MSTIVEQSKTAACQPQREVKLGQYIELHKTAFAVVTDTDNRKPFVGDFITH